MKVKHWVRLTAFLLTSFLVLSALTNFLCTTNLTDIVGMYGFYREPKNSIDIALIGPSNIQTSFYSPLAYEKYGFTSYALSIGGMRGSCYQSAIREMRSRQKPQVYVVDMWGFLYEDQHHEQYVRDWIDVLPDSKTRTMTIRELIPEEDQENYTARYKKYHGNWISLERCIGAFKYKSKIRSQGYSIVKNYVTSTNIAPINDKEERYTISKQGFQYLKEMIAYCKENNIQNVLFVRTLTMQPYTETPSLREAIEYVESEGYDYLDLSAVADEMGIDRSKDFYNDGHCNIYGTEKITLYLGNYLCEHYDLKLEHTDEVTAEWETCAGYTELIFEKCKESTDKKEKKYLHENDFFD